MSSSSKMPCTSSRPGHHKPGFSFYLQPGNTARPSREPWPHDGIDLHGDRFPCASPLNALAAQFCATKDMTCPTREGGVSPINPNKPPRSPHVIRGKIKPASWFPTLVAALIVVFCSSFHRSGPETAIPRAFVLLLSLWQKTSQF